MAGGTLKFCGGALVNTWAWGTGRGGLPGKRKIIS